MNLRNERATRRAREYPAQVAAMSDNIDLLGTAGAVVHHDYLDRVAAKLRAARLAARGLYATDPPAAA